MTFSLPVDELNIGLGDKIIQLQGRDVEVMTYDERAEVINSSIFGPTGSTVTLTILKSGNNVSSTVSYF
jgi:C-terminal processing protease CtpA/Prc